MSVFFTSAGMAASPQASQALIGNPALEYGPDSVLVRFSTSATADQKRNARALVNSTRSRNFNLVKGLEHLQLGRGLGVSNALQILRQLPIVEYAEPDFVLKADTNDPYFLYQWGLANTGQDIRGGKGTVDADIDADEAWNFSTGDSTFLVAVIDSGVEYTHPDLRGSIWINPEEFDGDQIDNDGNGYIDDVYGWDFYANDNNPQDEDGHGTHVSGTICAEGNNNIGVSGVAWRCRIMALRFLGPAGGYTSDAIAALNYAVDMGVRISNNSWGGNGYSRSLHDAIQNAGASGHLLIAAAGNDAVNSDSSPHYPSSYTLDNIISVAAIDNRDQLASFSNYGRTSVDLGAPGVDIASTMLSGYYWSSGTSMAAPHVTGVAVLILGTHPDWDYSQIRDRLLGSVRPVEALNGRTVTGGSVNAFSALLEPSTVPARPAGLVATPLSDSRIQLTWADDSTNEDGFMIERGLTGTDWQQVAGTDRDVTSYIDPDLAPQTIYYYRLQAYNTAGDSAYSEVVSATTEPMPTSLEINAVNESFGAGTVSGTLETTWDDDGVSETIVEQISGGRPSSRYSQLQHTWLIDLPPGAATLHLNSWSSPSSDGDRFRFSYSTDNSSFTDMLTVIGGDDATGWYSYALPPLPAGTLYIRVQDTDRTPGHQTLDALNVDRLFVQVEQQVGQPPLPPTNLTADPLVPGEVALAWLDLATTETGFEIERSTDGVKWHLLQRVAADTVAFSDITVAPENRYLYRLRAYNGSGYSTYSDVAAVSTPLWAAIELSVIAYKEKGTSFVELSWSGAAAAFNVYRNNTMIAESVGGSSFTDTSLPQDRGVSYTYQVCDSGSMSNCSNEAMVNF